MSTHTGIVPIGYEKRPVGGHRHVDRPEPLILLCFQNIYRGCFEPCSIIFHRVGTDYIRTCIGVDHLVAKNFGQQASFVNRNAARRSRARLQQIGYNTRIIQMPVAKRDFFFEIGPAGAPTGACHLISKPIISTFHYVIDPHAFIPIVIVVGLP